MKKTFRIVLGALALGWASGCQGSTVKAPAAHPPAPATVLQISDELELASVRLTEKAAQRLGISVAAVKRVAIVGRRPYPGVVVVPPESLTILTAPVTGTLHYQGPPPLAVGTPVSQGQALFSFTPLLVEDYALGPTQRESLRSTRLSIQQSDQAIQTRINNAKVEVEASRIDLRRAEELYKQNVGSRKRVDDARAREQLAREVLDSAQRERRTVQQVTQETSERAPRAMQQVSPLTGTILRVQVGSGQAVTAGQPLLDVVDLRKVWLRVRVPQAEAQDIQRGQSAQLSISGRNLQAQPIKGPPTGDQFTATQDLYFGVDNRAGVLNPDQRIEVSLPLRGSGQKLVVPSASVLYDIHGGTWVYMRTKTLEYKRERVVVEYAEESGRTVLAEGPPIGSTVVVNGAAELFGVEFGND